MIESEGFTFNPAEPGNETKIRAVKSHETPRAADERNIEPARWKVGDDLGDFEIEAAIGSGVTSSVYRVREKATGRSFAMKILRTRSEEMLTASRVGFRRIQKLCHPSLVRCDRMLLVGDNLAFTMEEVVGKRLVDVINEARADERAVTYELAIQLLHDIGGALQAIHAAGLVHRDVKPDNVMIDQQGRARLIDYGLVGSYDPVSDPDAKRGYLAGTYWYMAPESITKQIYPPACDVYSLGCMLLELVADRNRLPSVIDGGSLGQSLGSVRAYLPVDIPEELADLICDMIDPLPENRPVAARLVQVKRRPEPLDRAPSNFTDGHVHGRAKELEIAENWIHSVVDGKPKRLHISGDSGVGKTWFLQEIQRRLRSSAWFQVFDSTCRERSDVPLQTFDAMADAIARRYSRDDREKLRLAPRHAAVLRQAFPSLRSVITEPHFLANDHEPFRDLGSQTNQSTGNVANADDIARSDALLAGVELVDRMCEYGPVFLIVDDIQWADADSINVLGKVLSNANGNAGIITVGRSKNDRFRDPADCYIELQPLTESDSIALLRHLLCNGEFQWSELALKRLATLGEGNAHCITQLAACVGQDEAIRWHDQLLSMDVNIEDIWQSRVNQLSDVAKIVIEFLAVAGGPIRRSELAPASNLRDQCEVALKELIEVRLVYDEAPRRAVEDSESAGNAAMIAQANCAVAFRHLAVCDWASTISPSLKSVAAFRSQSQQNRFGDALARLPMNWSCLWLGRFRDLRSNVSAMTCDADERNDQSVTQLVHLGLGCAADLMNDTYQLQQQAHRSASASSSPWTQVLNGFSRLMKWQYDGEIKRAARYHRILVSGQRKTLIKQIQLLRVLDFQFEASIHIGMAFQCPADRDDSISIVQRVCQDLQKERIEYAKAIGTYFQAQVLEVAGDQDQSATKFAQAASIADSLGLIPMKLAAKDRCKVVLSENQRENQSSELDDFLALGGVKVPGKFARLYCGLR